MAYGVCCNGDDSGNFDYIAGVEVSDFSDLPREFARVRIPEQRYAVFTHAEHISTIRRTVNTIWNHWLPASGLKAADAPNFERYDEKFDPVTGNGGLEIWVPVEGVDLRAARLPCAAAMPALAWQAMIDFAITCATKCCACGIEPEIRLQPKKPGGFHGQYPRSRHRSGVSGRAGGDA